MDPRLETLLDQRDHLRIKISLAEDDPLVDADLSDLRGRLVELDHKITKSWGNPYA